MAMMSIFVKICREGFMDLAVMRYKSTTLKPSNEEMCEAFIAVCGSNNELIMRWLYRTGNITQVALSAGIQKCLDVGNMNIAQWIWENEQIKDTYLTRDYPDGYLKVRKYWRGIYGTDLVKTDDVTIADWCAKGNLKIVSWLYEIRRNGSGSSYYLHRAMFTAAAINNQIHILKWFTQFRLIHEFVYFKSVFAECCVLGHTDAIKWCINNCLLDNHNIENVCGYIEICIDNGQWSTAVYIALRFKQKATPTYARMINFVQRRAIRLVRKHLRRRWTTTLQLMTY